MKPVALKTGKAIVTGVTFVGYALLEAIACIVFCFPFAMFVSFVALIALGTVTSVGLTGVSAVLGIVLPIALAVLVLLVIWNAMDD